MENVEELAALEEIELSSEEVYSGRLLHVFKDKVALPNGHNSTREYIKHNGASAVVPVTDDGKLILEHQFRYPFHDVLIEIPAGKLDSAEEDPLEAAKRELREETGYSAEEWISLGPIYPSVAYTTEVIWMYMARGLKKGDQELDKDEFLNVYEIPLEEALDKIMKGEIGDAKTQAAILKVARILGK